MRWRWCPRRRTSPGATWPPAPPPTMRTSLTAPPPPTAPRRASRRASSGSSTPSSSRSSTGGIKRLKYAKLKQVIDRCGLRKAPLAPQRSLRLPATRLPRWTASPAR
eukprot:107733-Prorocentrum_minimum.AAC.5